MSDKGSRQGGILKFNHALVNLENFSNKHGRQAGRIDSEETSGGGSSLTGLSPSEAFPKSARFNGPVGPDDRHPIGQPEANLFKRIGLLTQRRQGFKIHKQLIEPH